MLEKFKKDVEVRLDEVYERMRQIQKQNWFSFRKVAKLLRVHPRTATETLQAKRVPSLEFIMRFCQAFNVSADWLLFGIGDPTIGRENEFVFIPRVDVQVGAGGECEVYDAETREVYAFRRDWLARKGSINDMKLVRVRGDSMEPTLSDGDLVLIDISKRTPEDGIYVVRIYNGLAVKRLQRIDRSSVRLISDNMRYPPEIYRLDSGDFEIIGRVIWAGKDLT